MELTEEENMRINDLRKRIINGEEVSDTELREAIQTLRKSRAKVLTAASKKQTETKEKKAKDADLLASIKSDFGL